MAGTGLKLINKLARRTKQVKESAGGFNRFDQIFLNPKTMQDSPRAYEVMRKAERRQNRAMGNFALARAPVLHAEYVATSLGRISIGGGLYATELVLPALDEGYGGSGVLVGDYVLVVQQNSVAEGQYLEVTAVISTTELQLTDVPAFAFAGTSQVSSVTTVADTAGSLNSTYWTISTPSTHYYVWYSDGTGVDPAPGGTGIPVVYTDNATAATIATLTQSALNGVAGAWTTTRTNANLMITDQAVGSATDAANGTASPGFTISTPTPGVNANPTPTAETDVAVRLEVNEPKSYY